MKKIFGILLLTLAVFASGASNAQEHPAKVQEFCAQPRTQPPGKGIQFDNKPAEATAMDLVAGHYETGTGVVVVLNGDNSFWVKVAPGPEGIKGSSGDDLMEPGVVGGCFREQLSEVLVNNKVPLEKLKKTE